MAGGAPTPLHEYLPYIDADAHLVIAMQFALRFRSIATETVHEKKEQIKQSAMLQLGFKPVENLNMNCDSCAECGAISLPKPRHQHDLTLPNSHPRGELQWLEVKSCVRRLSRKFC